MSVFPNHHHTDPYGPMSGRNLVVESLEEASLEGESYCPPPADISVLL